MPFGVVAAVASAVTEVATAVGIGAATAGTIGAIAAPALVGAGVGALGSAITGGDPLKGAELGGLAGLGGGVGGVLGGAGDLGGLTAAEGGALGGAVGGLAGGAATGAKGTGLLLDTAGGAFGGYAANGGFSGSVPTTGGVGGGGTSAAATALPAGGAADAAGATDLTATGGIPASPAITSQALGLPDASAAAASPAAVSSQLGVPAGDAASSFSSGAITSNPSAPAVTGSGGGFGGGFQTATPDPGQIAASPPALGGPAANPYSTGAGVAGGSASAAPATTLGSFLKNPSLGGAGKLIESNPAAVVGALGLADTALKSQTVPQQGNLSGIAGNLNSESQQMLSYLQSGKLPPGAQQAVDAAMQANEAAIRQQYSAQGLSGSTMETQALEAARTEATTQALNLATQLTQQGVSEAQISAELYNNLAGLQTAQNADMSKAIADFAASLAGGSGTTKYSLTPIT